MTKHQSVVSQKLSIRRDLMGVSGISGPQGKGGLCSNRDSAG